MNPESAEAASDGLAHLLRGDEAYQLLFWRNPQPAWILETSSLRFVEVNAAAEAFYGYSRAELLSQTIADTLDPEDAARLWEKARALPAGNSSGTWRVIRKSGEARWLEVVTQQLPSKPTLRLVHGADVTNLVRTTETQRQSEIRFARLRDSGVVGIVVSDAGGRLLETNGAFLKMVGRSADELKGELTWAQLTPAEWSHTTARVRDELQRSAVVPVFEKEYLRHDGSRVPVLVAAALLADGNHITVVVDLTAQRSTEEALRRSEHLFRTIVENSSDAICLMSPDTTMTYVSPGGTKITGAPASALVGIKLSEVVQDREGYMEGWRHCLDQPGVTLRNLYSVVVPNGGGVRHLESFRTNYLSEPSIGAVVSVVRDLTDQLRLAEELRQAQKVEAIGALAGGVAHDFNNLLTVILGYSDGLVQDPSLEAGVRNDLGEIRKAAERAAVLTRRLLTFSRKQILSPRVLDLHEVLPDTEKLVRRLLTENIELTFSLAPELRNIKADPTEVEQILMNLIINARDAMPNGGKVDVRARNASVDAAATRAHKGAQPGDYVLLTVQDDGTGMAPETQARVFEPFFTTKNEQGTGLGLATVFGIAQRSGGFVTVCSELGKGSTFDVYLPVTEERESAHRTHASGRSATTLRGTETVLLAEDEAQARAVLREVLVQKGYQVVPVGNGGEALRAAEAAPRKFHLLLTDVVMPGMSGRELAERLQAMHSELRVLYMSGYAGDEELQRWASEGRIALLPKPVTPEALLRRVREVLDA